MTKRETEADMASGREGEGEGEAIIRSWNLFPEMNAMHWVKHVFHFDTLWFGIDDAEENVPKMLKLMLMFEHVQYYILHYYARPFMNMWVCVCVYVLAST